jgi:hypothetical protein
MADDTVVEFHSEDDDRVVLRLGYVAADPVYRRLVETGDQYLLQAGHHAFTSYRTIVSVGLMRIEERA